MTETPLPEFYTKSSFAFYQVHGRKIEGKREDCFLIQAYWARMEDYNLIQSHWPSPESTTTTVPFSQWLKTFTDVSVGGRPASRYYRRTARSC